MIDLHLSAFAPRWRFLYVVRIDAYINSSTIQAEGRNHALPRGNSPLYFFALIVPMGALFFKEEQKLKKENRLLTIDGETLMSQPLTPLNFVVDTLISQGLHILAGSPKVGKSWLALWLAVTVAKGESVWGMGVKQGTTLYLCLDDSTLRIQNRLFEITEDAPASVHFTTNSDTLGKGLEEQLCAFLSEHPDTVLIIIDTLQMIRGAGYDNSGKERL